MGLGMRRIDLQGLAKRGLGGRLVVALQLHVGQAHDGLEIAGPGGQRGLRTTASASANWSGVAIDVAQVEMGFGKLGRQLHGPAIAVDGLGRLADAGSSSAARL